MCHVHEIGPSIARLFMIKYVKAGSLTTGRCHHFCKVPHTCEEFNPSVVLSGVGVWLCPVNISCVIPFLSISIMMLQLVQNELQKFSCLLLDIVSPEDQQYDQGKLLRTGMVNNMVNQNKKQTSLLYCQPFFNSIFYINKFVESAARIVRACILWNTQAAKSI